MVRNEVLKPFITERDKVIKVRYERLNFLASFLLPFLMSLSKNSSHRDTETSQPIMAHSLFP